MYNYVMKSIWGSKYPILVNKNSISKISMQQLRKYSNDTFSRDNVKIAFSGKLGDIFIMEYSNYILSKLNNRAKIKPMKYNMNLDGKVHVKYYDGLEQEIIYFVFKLPRVTDKNHHLILMLHELLAGHGLNSLLIQKVRYDLGLVYYIHGDLLLETYGNIWVIKANTAINGSDKVIQGVKDVLKSINSDNKKIDINNIKQWYSNNQLFSISNTSAAVSQLLYYAERSDNVIPFSDININSVGLDDLINTYNTYANEMTTFIMKRKPEK